MQVLLMTRVEQLFLLKPLSSSCWVTVCLFGSRMFATLQAAILLKHLGHRGVSTQTGVRFHPTGG